MTASPLHIFRIAVFALVFALSAYDRPTANAQDTRPESAWRAQSTPLILEHIKIPSSVPGPLGSTTYMLDALLVRPPVDRRLPLAVITHGTPRENADRRKMDIMGFARVARDFARRGWVAAVVMRRGHGVSEGEYVEGMTCANPDYVHSGRMSVYDLRSAVRYLSQQPYVDPGRVIGIGQSTGGFAWLATSADPPPNLAAVINFAGGHGSLRPRENCSENQMLLAMRTFGATSRIPSLWIYSENDSYIVPDFATRMHAAFTAVGGQAEFKLVPPFEDDGHPLMLRTTGSYVWTPLVDAFLRAHGLPTWTVADMHADLIPASRRANYQRFLAGSAEKAFALALDGGFSTYWSGVAAIDDAKQHARAECEGGGKRNCRIFAINFAIRPAPP